MPGFLYERFKRQEVQAGLAAAAKAVLGRELRVQLVPLQDQGERRSLEELRPFKEVQFK